jgi:hypothetical protein
MPKTTLHNPALRPVTAEPADQTIVLVTWRRRGQEILSCWQRNDLAITAETDQETGHWWLVAGPESTDPDGDGVTGPFGWGDVIGSDPTSTSVQQMYFPEELTAEYNRGFCAGVNAAAAAVDAVGTP